MKQLPRVSSLLYGMPWGILPSVHAELGALYRSYLTGTLPDAPAMPEALEQAGWISSGIRYEADHAAGIAVIHISGIISKRAPDMLCGPTLCDLGLLDQVIEDAGRDEAIETVILDINSPGGCVIGLDETAENLRELAETKRLIAYTDYQACSCGYYLAAACDEIYASPSAVIGAIGTYCAGLDDSRAWEMEGLELKLFRVGSLKAIGHPGKKWTPEEEQHLQETADAAGKQFRSWVGGRREGVPEEAMQGQWFFAKDAPNGIVDGLFRDLPRLIAAVIEQDNEG